MTRLDCCNNTKHMAHVLCLLEQSALAIFHAAQSHLESLNRIQRSFVQELGLTEAQAFLQFRLAPLELRRDIAALGFLHKIQLGDAHLDFDGLFPKAAHLPVRTVHQRCTFTFENCSPKLHT